MALTKFSVSVDPALLDAIDARAGAASVCRADWVRDELARAANPAEPDENPDVLALRNALDDAETDRDRLAAVVDELTADRDRLTTATADARETLVDRDRLAALVVERDGTIAGLTADRDRLAAELRTATDTAASTAVELAELRTRTADDRETIRRLEGDIHWSRTKIDELTPRLLAETVEEGRRPWWKFWGS